MAELKRLFEFADEFGITTAQALELCDIAGIPARDGGTLLTGSDAARLRQAAAGAGLGNGAGPAGAGPFDPAEAGRPGRPAGVAVAPPPGWVHVNDLGDGPSAGANRSGEAVVQMDAAPPSKAASVRSRWRGRGRRA
jgi:hypothetical protein